MRTEPWHVGGAVPAQKMDDGDFWQARCSVCPDYRGGIGSMQEAQRSAAQHAQAKNRAADLSRRRL